MGRLRLTALYHTKGYQGTTTVRRRVAHAHPIIPYQGLSGNYNPPPIPLPPPANYTIPRAIRELQLPSCTGEPFRDYTIPRAIRELQHENCYRVTDYNYTIPRAIRELQPGAGNIQPLHNYTIPRAIRELQLLLSLQLLISILYHTKGYQGTTTDDFDRIQRLLIIPYQGLSGNYNKVNGVALTVTIIPYQGLSGNYNRQGRGHWSGQDYTIPRAIRELQRRGASPLPPAHYTIPRAIRELQPSGYNCFAIRPIIPYQGLSGNYNSRLDASGLALIIPYQGLSGNYN